MTLVSPPFSPRLMKKKKFFLFSLDVHLFSFLKAAVISRQRLFFASKEESADPSRRAPPSAHEHIQGDILLSPFLSPPRN